MKLDGPCHMKGDNMSVIHNCSNPVSQLKKKSNSIVYHYVRERCAGKKTVARISWVPTDKNPSDVLTKSQPGPVRNRLVEGVLYYPFCSVLQTGCSPRGQTYSSLCWLGCYLPF